MTLRTKPLPYKWRLTLRVVVFGRASAFDVALCRRCAVNRYCLCKSGRAVADSSEAESLFQHESIPLRSLTDLSPLLAGCKRYLPVSLPVGAYIHLLPLHPPSYLTPPVDLSVSGVWICSYVFLTVFFSSYLFLSVCL